MNIEEFYTRVGGKYENVVAQLLSEERVMKYVNKFAENQTFQKLEENLIQRDYENAFLEAHNLKGICLNIGITDLSIAASDLTESLRGGPKGDVDGLFKVLKEKYDETIELIKQIEM